MATITVRVSEDEKLFLNKMATLEGKSLSDLLKTKTLSSLEDSYDAKIGDLAYEEYLQNPETISHEAMMEKYGLADSNK